MQGGIKMTSTWAPRLAHMLYPMASLSLSVDIHLNVLNNSYDRMIVSIRTSSGDGHLMTDSPWANFRACGSVVVHLEPHAVVDLVVLEGDVVIVDCVPAP
jgi:hypothetical protein